MADTELRCELFVDDVGESVAFYGDVLGFAETSRADDHATIRRESIRLGIRARDSIPDDHYFDPESLSERKGIGVELVLDVADVDEMRERLRRVGYPVKEELQMRPWDARDFRLVDPDGYYLRVTEATGPERH